MLHGVGFMRLDLWTVGPAAFAAAGVEAGFFSWWLDMEEFLVKLRCWLPVYSAATSLSGSGRLPGPEVRSCALRPVRLPSHAFDSRTNFRRRLGRRRPASIEVPPLEGRAPKLPLPALDDRQRDHRLTQVLGLCAIARFNLAFGGSVIIPLASEWRSHDFFPIRG